jgi:acetyl-CoA synthetase
MTEAAVVGFPHEIKGQGIFAFVTPDHIEWVPQLPKNQNRSGKILRRILMRIAVGDFENHGDTPTVADPTVWRISSAGSRFSTSEPPYLCHKDHSSSG